MGKKHCLRCGNMLQYSWNQEGAKCWDMAMSSLERVLRAARRGKPDVLPVGPYMGNHGAHAAGYRIGDYCTSGKSMAKAQYAAWELYGQDIAVAQSDAYYIAEGFGSVVEFHEDGTPTLRKPALDSVFRADSLRLPNPYADGRMPVYLEAIRLLSGSLGGKVCIRAPGTGPFALASHLLGIQEFLMAIAEAEYDGRKDIEQALFRLLGLTSDALIAFLTAALETGANIVQCGDSLASLDVISPFVYEKYAFPYEKKVFAALRPYAEKYDGCTLLHICGDNTKVMGLLAGAEEDILEVDYKVDLGLYKEKIGSKVSLMGNLDPTGVLLQGTPEDVESVSRKCIAEAASGGGFILGSGCEVPIHAPVENIRAMIRVARKCEY